MEIGWDLKPSIFFLNSIGGASSHHFMEPITILKAQSLQSANIEACGAVQASIAANTYVVSGPSQVQSMPLLLAHFPAKLDDAKLKSPGGLRFWIVVQVLDSPPSFSGRGLAQLLVLTCAPFSSCRHPGAAPRHHEPDRC